MIFQKNKQHNNKQNKQQFLKKSPRSESLGTVPGDQKQDSRADKAKTEAGSDWRCPWPKVAQESIGIIVFSKSLLGGNYSLSTQG